MQNPTMNTRVPKCLQLALFAEKMLSKFPDNPTLVALAAKMAGARTALASTHYAYADAVIAIVSARADVRWADFVGDQVVRGTQREAEKADGHKNGRIASMVLPNGVTPIVKPVGATQVQEMRTLEGKLEAAAGIWPGALAEKAKNTAARTDYEAALEGRRAAGQKAADLRALRDAAKEDFVSVYASITSRVKAEFPRDRRKQDLFFDTVSADSAVEKDDEEDDDTPMPAEGAEDAGSGGATPA